MAKQEQVVSEVVTEQALEETVRPIAQAQSDYDQLMEEIRDYCHKAKQLRERSTVLKRSGRMDSHVGTEIRQLLDKAEQFELLADQCPKKIKY